MRAHKSSPHPNTLTQFSLPSTFAVMHIRCPSLHVALAAQHELHDQPTSPAAPTDRLHP